MTGAPINVIFCMQMNEVVAEFLRYRKEARTETPADYKFKGLRSCDDGDFRWMVKEHDFIDKTKGTYLEAIF